MCPDLVLFRHQCVESFPRFADRRMDILAKGNAVKLIEHCLVEALSDAIIWHDTCGAFECQAVPAKNGVMVSPSGTRGTGSTKVRAGRR